ncbi:tannase/feruloyl esterase family alpha/beta hydrolase [Noviherbaspirillum soli]|uniref:tannase/feruloyl esterase family alpha/beta hydrolase n=1 Tax=Noviherbaspirillum soli TaxID=1064518 RepID=UPI0038994E9E
MLRVEGQAETIMGPHSAAQHSLASRCLCCRRVVHALDRWVARGTAPPTPTSTRLAKGTGNRTCHLYPYPQVAKYKGSGSLDVAGCFGCVNL